MKKRRMQVRGSNTHQPHKVDSENQILFDLLSCFCYSCNHTVRLKWIIFIIIIIISYSYFCRNWLVSTMWCVEYRVYRIWTIYRLHSLSGQCFAVWNCNWFTLFCSSLVKFRPIRREFRDYCIDALNPKVFRIIKRCFIIMLLGHHWYPTKSYIIK